MGMVEQLDVCTRFRMAPLSDSNGRPSTEQSVVTDSIALSFSRVSFGG